MEDDLLDEPDEAQAGDKAEQEDQPEQNFFDQFDEAETPENAEPTSGNGTPTQNFFDQFDAPAKQAAPKQNFFDQFDAAKSEPEGALARGVRNVAHGILPAVAGLAAAPIGAAAGALTSPVTGPVGPFVGGVGAYMLAAGATEKLQHSAMDMLGVNDDAQMAANAEAHPYETAAEQLIPALAGMSPGKGLQLAQRGFSAATMGGLSAIQDYASTGKFDPANIAIGAAAGAAFPNVNKLGARIQEPGEQFAAKYIPGRPDTASPTKAVDTADAAVSQSPSVAGNNALAQQPAPDPKSPNPDSQVLGTKVKAEGATSGFKRPTADEVFGDSGFSTGPAHTDPTLQATLAPEEPPKLGQTGLVEAAAEQAPQPVPPPGRVAAEDQYRAYTKPAPVEAPAPKPQATLAPAEGEVSAPVETPPPSENADTKLLQQLRANGMEKLAAKFEAAPPATRDLIRDQIAKSLPQASKHAPERSDYDARKNKLGNGTKNDTIKTRHNRAIDAVQKAYDEHAPPEGEETAEQLMARLRSAVDTANKAHGSNPLNPTKGYNPQVKPESFQWLKKVQTLTDWTPGKIAEFKADEDALRSSKGKEEEYPYSDKLEQNIELNRHTGDELVRSKLDEQAVSPEDRINAALDAERAGTSVEDAVRAIDEGYRTEEEETAAKPREVKIRNRADLRATLRPEDDLTAPVAKPKATPAEVKITKGSEISAEEKARILKEMGAAQAKGRSRAAPKATYEPEDKYSPWKGVKDLLGDVAENQSGKLDIGKIKEDLKKWMGVISRGPVDDSSWTIKKRPSYIAKEITSENQQAGRNVADRLNITGKVDNSISNEMQKAKKEAHKLASTPEKQRELYDAMDNPDKITDPKLRQVFDQTIMPARVMTSYLRDAIRKLSPETDIGRDTEDMKHRIALNGGPKEPELGTVGSDVDPVAGPLSTTRRAPVMERRFVALEDAKGNRHVVYLDVDKAGRPTGKYSIWKDYKSKEQPEDSPDMDFKLNGEYEIGKRKFTMRDATEDEIEANALGNDNQPMKYQRDAAASAYTSLNYHLKMFNHLKTIDDLKNSPEFAKYATKSNNEAVAKDWKKSDTPGFKDYYMDDHLRESLEDAYQPGVNDDALTVARNLSRAMTQSIFLIPTAHALNVANHWVVGRGFNWIKPEGYKSLAMDGATAIKSVITHDKIQRALAEHGAGLIYPGIRASNSTQQLALGIGRAIERSPSKWGPIADTLDMTVGDLVRGIYRASQHGMWSANDMFLTQGILERLRLQGKTLDSATKPEIEDAIAHVEQHIPNYRAPARVIGSGDAGRFIAKKVRDPLYVAFGRYGYAVMNSFANMVKNVAHGDKEARIEAVGQMMVMGALAFGVYPYIYKPIAQALTGNKDAEARPRGPIAVYSRVKEAVEKGDLSPLLRDTPALSPFLSTIFQLGKFKDFADRPIADKKDVHDALHGGGKAAARVAGQVGGFLAQQRYAPLSTLNSALGNPKQGAGGGLRDAILDLKSPSPGATKYDAQTPRRINQGHNQRVKKLPNIGDKALRKLGLE